MPDIHPPRSGPVRRTTATERREPGWDPLLTCVAALLLTAVGRVHLLFPALTGLHLTLVAGGGALVLYLLDGRAARGLAALRSPTALCVLGLLAWAAVGIPFAFRQGHSLSYLHGYFLKAVLVGMLVAGCVRGVRDVERLAFVYFAGAALYAGIVLLRFDVGATGGRLLALYTYDPNDFATFAVTAIPLGVYFLVRKGAWMTRVFACAGILALSATIVWSGSRGGFIALLVVSAYLLFRYRETPVRWRALGVGLVFAGLLAVGAEPFWDRMATIVDIEEDYNVTAETGRLQIWKRGLGYVRDRPVLGLGLDNFRAAEGNLSARAELAEYGIGVPWTPPHNSFVQVAAELGLPGLALFLGIFWTLIGGLGRVARASSRAPPNLERAARLAPILVASILGFAAGAFFLSLAYSDMLYALVGLGVGLLKTTNARETGARGRSP